MSAVATASPTPARSRSAGDVVRGALRGLGQLLITVGVVILLFVAYELWWTNVETARQQHHLAQQLHQLWSRPQSQIPSISAAPLGHGIAVLYIPRFGAHYHPVIVQGTGYDQLAEGPGHWVGSAYPGQLGNFYVAGHRTTHSEPFNRLAELRKGDNIYIETAKAWYTYRLQNIPGDPHAHWQEIVSPYDLPISYPVPDQPNPRLRPTQRVLTFSTCNPEYSASQRLVVHGLLVSMHPRTPGYRPKAIVNG